MRSAPANNAPDWRCRAKPQKPRVPPRAGLTCPLARVRARRGPLLLRRKRTHLSGTGYLDAVGVRCRLTATNVPVRPGNAPAINGHKGAAVPLTRGTTCAITPKCTDGPATLPRCAYARSLDAAMSGKPYSREPPDGAVTLIPVYSFVFVAILRELSTTLRLESAAATEHNFVILGQTESK